MPRPPVIPESHTQKFPTALVPHSILPTPPLRLVPSAAPMASAAATTTSAPAQNLNPLSINIKLPPWLSGLRCPFTFVCPPPPPPPPLPPPPPPLPPTEPVVPRSRRLPSLRVTTEYDSEEGVFVNKVSCKLAGDLAKLRLSFQSDPQGQWQGGGEEGDPLQQLFAAPLVGLITKRFSVHYDVEARNALLRGDCSLPGGAVQLRASHDVKVLRHNFQSRNAFTSGQQIIFAY